MADLTGGSLMVEDLTQLLGLDQLVPDTQPMPVAQPPTRQPPQPKQQKKTETKKRASAKKPRGSDEPGTVDEKRIKFLERNRAAATRCRQKKKQLMQELQQKASDLAMANEALRSEYDQLTKEIEHLRKRRRPNPGGDDDLGTFGQPILHAPAEFTSPNL